MIERHARHALMPGWRQDLLKRATVILAGAGALGNSVAQILALAGVGNLLVVDHDNVETSNLSRTPLFRPADIGRSKAAVAAESLRGLAPEIVVEGREGKFEAAVGLGEIDAATLIISALDSRAARLSLASRCGLVEAPVIDGGTNAWGGEVRLYLDRQGACYGCGLSARERAEADFPWSCAAVQAESPSGANAATSGIVGAWMAHAAIQTLLGLGSTGATAIAIDPLAGAARRINLVRDPQCPFHHPTGAVTRIAPTSSSTVADLLAALPEPGAPLLWRPVEADARCNACGRVEEPWRPARMRSCPSCGELLSIRPEVDLTRAPPHLRLSDLGVPPGEFLAVRTKQGISYVALADRLLHDRPRPDPRIGARMAGSGEQP